jgi:hypothetical protein
MLFKALQMTYWLIGFYCFAALCGGFIWFMMSLNRPRFRDDVGDVTTEVGYEEDSVGLPTTETEEPFRDNEGPHAIGEPGSANSVI